METLILYIFYILIGIGSGFLGGLLGIGGGLVVVPAMIYIFKWLDFPITFQMQVAIGTSLASMVFTSASSAFAHYLRGGVIWNLFWPLAPGVIIGSILGALLASSLPSKQLEYLFGIFMCLNGIYFMFFYKIVQAKHGVISPSFYIIGPIGVFIGLLSTLLGIGGGMITVPVLAAFGTPLKNAISTSAANGMVIAFIGGISLFYLGFSHETFKGSLGYVYIPAFVVISVISSIAAPFGVKTAYALPVNHLRRIFGVIMIGVGIMIIF